MSPEDMTKSATPETSDSAPQAGEPNDTVDSDATVPAGAPEDPDSEIVRTQGNDFVTKTELGSLLADFATHAEVADAIAANKGTAPTDPLDRFVTKRTLDATIQALRDERAKDIGTGITEPTDADRAAWSAEEAKHKWIHEFQKILNALIIKGESATSKTTLATAASATDKLLEYLDEKFPKPVPAP